MNVPAWTHGTPFSCPDPRQPQACPDRKQPWPQPCLQQGRTRPRQDRRLLEQARLARPQGLGTIRGHRGSQGSQDRAHRAGKVRGYGICRHHWEADIVQARGFGVTSLVQTVMDSVVRLELPEAVAVADSALGSRRMEGERLTRIDLQRASTGLASTSWASLLRSCRTVFMTSRDSLRGPTSSGRNMALSGSSTATPSTSTTNFWTAEAHGKPFWRRKSGRTGFGRSATPLFAGTGTPSRTRRCCGGRSKLAESRGKNPRRVVNTPWLERGN